MVKHKRKASGWTRARRPKTGSYKKLLVVLSDKEKVEMDCAAKKAGLSLSRFILERALKAARRVLSIGTDLR